MLMPENCKRGWLATIAVMSLLVAPGALAKVQTYQLDGATVKLDLPEGWIDAKDLMTIPLSVFGPMKNDARPVMSLVNSGKKGSAFKFDEKGLKDTEWQYRLGRRDYLSSVGGQLVEFRDYETTRINGVEAHKIGYRYRVGPNEFSEMSYYLNCKDQAFLLKTVARDRADESTLERVAKSFQCE